MSVSINKKKGLWMDELDEETRNQMKLSIVTLLEDENEDEITQEIVKQTSENFNLNAEKVIEFCKRFIDSRIVTFFFKFFQLWMSVVFFTCGPPGGNVKKSPAPSGEK